MKLLIISISFVIILSIFSIQQQSVHAKSSTSITCLENGTKADGQMIYNVDHATLKFSEDWSFEKPSDLENISATENSNVIVTDSEVITDIVLKIPSKDNPDSYDIDASGGTFKIANVEILDNQLNKYNLKFSIEADYYTITPTLTETSPTTATLTNVFDLSAFDKSYFSTGQETDYNTSELERQLEQVRERIILEQN
ncbi:MAG TPA: hypothetical protein VFG45_02740 [Candidatus Nitrosocosmicus sp.]|nr:hypothetical protein [Candidatus Nitrosocosmicus sp.]